MFPIFAYISGSLSLARVNSSLYFHLELYVKYPTAPSMSPADSLASMEAHMAFRSLSTAASMDSPACEVMLQSNSNRMDSNKSLCFIQKTLSNPPLPPFSKGGNFIPPVKRGCLISPFEKGGLRGIFHQNLCIFHSP